MKIGNPKKQERANILVIVPWDFMTDYAVLNNRDDNILYVGEKECGHIDKLLKANDGSKNFDVIIVDGVYNCLTEILNDHGYEGRIIGVPTNFPIGQVCKNILHDNINEELNPAIDELLGNKKDPGSFKNLYGGNNEKEST